ncbi:MAG: hypothetical protein A3A80_02345 [Candidatus Terrybacteria bacterium RIFCSPLOWO2_01_FULL_44_24]|uniref:Uncharacterized protein n=1 Tax=Candidatus Terrybacteria bacterium RIFCSPHIGHO2_01_FULL_43_35 TaxID=1802361 RepID=A0A1G2PGD5_9BACT|nr:MAG: hypothetical protein A2828_02135 [Candidatus Terrybacteria bacterium RIFCSPHIGHO2_01_FULL_43_35]OHA50919.1 MAG: hypothetical protein A3A80_02345 [Candidatus Terrybacteria bacterium RIFCSPLOWO2_01_FULL_44_24]
MRRFFRKLIKPGFYLLMLGLAIYGGSAFWHGNFVRNLKASIFSNSPVNQPAIGSAASFLHDEDGDGLSDAKELIYGTNPNNPDTDGDRYKDGDEVKNGYDPTLSGRARVDENTKLASNLTVQYFSWLQTKTGDNDPRLDEKQIEKFLTEKKMDAFILPEISDRDINISAADGTDAVKNYLKEFSTIQLPAETASYFDIAQSVVQEQKADVVEKVLAGINETEQHIRNLQTPKEAVDLQKGYLGLFKGLRELFADLYEINTDPVKLMRDVRWGGDLVQQGYALERIRLGLEEKYNPPAVQNPPTSGEQQPAP